MDLQVIQAWEEMIKNGLPGAIATIVSTEGSVPRHVGSKMMVKPDRNIVGTIGGGVLENEVMVDALKVIESQNAILKEYKLSSSENQGIGMTCGGKVVMFIEPVNPMERLLIIGAGHIAVSLVPIAKQLGFHVTLVEDRKEYLSIERFPGVDQIQQVESGDIDAFIQSTKLEYVVMVNRHGGCDVGWLKSILNKNEAKYIGCIGSRLRTKTTMDELIQSGISKDLFKKIHTPVGLEIGAETPDEIAISIFAEIIAVKREYKKS
jgi:xanthine dehydrogenase accessory factor